MIYLIGSLRNPEVPKIANKLEEYGFDIFADWYAAGETADDSWRDYEKARGRTYLEALNGYAAKNVFEFDKRHLERSEAVILVAPAGKSGHLELGWALGKGKPGYYLLDNPDRWDVMLQFCSLVTDKLEDIVEDLRPKFTTNTTEMPQQMQFTWVDLVSGETGTVLGPANAGKHISVAKPLMPSEEEWREMVNSAMRYGKNLRGKT